MATQRADGCGVRGAGIDGKQLQYTAHGFVGAGNVEQSSLLCLFSPGFRTACASPSVACVGTAFVQRVLRA
nr:MAG: hypothetical protein DIU78_06505 [Pseudomonadota bacterium]